jgi:hypothetical protein
MSDRLERKIQNARGCDLSLAVYSYGAQLIFVDLTPYILPKETVNKHISAWVQAVDGSTQHNKSITRKGQWHKTYFLLNTCIKLHRHNYLYKICFTCPKSETTKHCVQIKIDTSLDW